MTDQPIIRTELMRKSRFLKLQEQESFRNVEDKANEEITNANPEDILAVTMSFDNPIDVLEAKVITPDEFLKEAFLD